LFLDSDAVGMSLDFLLGLIAFGSMGVSAAASSSAVANPKAKSSEYRRA
jgi:hypothetical protein